MECKVVTGLNRRLILAALSVFVVLLSACGGNNGRISPDRLPPTTEILAPEYRLGEGDLIAVSVWKNPDLSVEVPVRPDGFISVPLVGDVKAGGRTPAEISADTEQRLAQFVRTPKVSIIVKNLVSSEFQNRVRVVGAVSEPQSVSHRKGMTVIDLVLEAGGTNDFASPQGTKLYRKEGNATKVYPIFLRSILRDGILDTNYLLMPGDVVSVPERRF